MLSLEDSTYRSSPIGDFTSAHELRSPAPPVSKANFEPTTPPRHHPTTPASFPQLHGEPPNNQKPKNTTDARNREDEQLRRDRASGPQDGRHARLGVRPRRGARAPWPVDGAEARGGEGAGVESFGPVCEGGGEGSEGAGGVGQGGEWEGCYSRPGEGEA